MVAVLIAGTVGLNVMVSAVDAYRTFGNTASFARAQVVAQSAAAAIEAEPYVAYPPPTTTLPSGAYTVPSGLVPAGWPQPTVGVTNAASTLTLNGASGAGSLSWSAQNPDSGLQEVTVSVTSPDGQVHAQLSFLKDDEGA